MCIPFVGSIFWHDYCSRILSFLSFCISQVLSCSSIHYFVLIRTSNSFFLSSEIQFENNNWHEQGGLKAVVWTDVVQSASMFGALILVAVKGSIDLGGADIVFKNALDTNRIEAPK